MYLPPSLSAPVCVSIVSLASHNLPNSHLLPDESVLRAACGEPSSCSEDTRCPPHSRHFNKNTHKADRQQNVTFLSCPLFRVTRMAHACNTAHAHYKSVSVTRKLFTELKILFLFTCLLYFRNTITNVNSLKYTGFVQNYFGKDILITRTLIGYAVAWCNISVSNRGRQRPFFFLNSQQI